MSNIQNAYKYLPIRYHMKYVRACIEKLWDRFPCGCSQCLWLAMCLGGKRRPVAGKVMGEDAEGGPCTDPGHVTLSSSGMHWAPSQRALPAADTSEHSWVHSYCFQTKCLRAQSMAVQLILQKAHKHWFMFSCSLSGSTSENYWSSGYIVP